MLADQLGHHRTNLTEHLAPFLDEQFVRRTDPLFRRTVEEAEIVADVVGELGQQFATDDIELMGRRRQVCTLDQHGGRGIAKNEVAVTVTEVQVAGADFRADHQDGAGLAQLHGIAGGVDAEGRGRTGDVHVKAKALDAQCCLNFDRDGRISPLQVGTGNDYRVNVGCSLASALQCLLGGGDGHLAENRLFVIGTFRQAWRHARRVENALLIHDETALDAAGFLDERGIRFGQCLDLTALDGRAVVGVELLHIKVERLHQLFIGDTVGRGIQAGAADDDVMHGRSSIGCPCARNGLFRQ
ncbi:hypothetical protein D3C80_854060 [compost metagenome]